MDAKLNRRVLLSAAIAAPVLIRPASGIMQLRGDASLFGGGVLPADNWMRGRGAKSPAFRLVFVDGKFTGWQRYDANCIYGSGAHGPAEALEISIWAPGGMRAITRIPVDIGKLI